MKIIMNTNERMSKKDTKAVLAQLASEEVSKGSAIRSLFAGGYSVKEISEMTTIKYNHVYNVCKQEVYKRNLEEAVSTAREGGTKKAAVLEQLALGKTVTEVSKEMGILYNQVWQIAKASGFTPKQKAAASLEVSHG